MLKVNRKMFLLSSPGPKPSVPKPPKELKREDLKRELKRESSKERYKERAWKRKLKREFTRELGRERVWQISYLKNIHYELEEPCPVGACLPLIK